MAGLLLMPTPPSSSSVSSSTSPSLSAEVEADLRSLDGFAFSPPSEILRLDCGDGDDFGSGDEGENEDEEEVEGIKRWLVNEPSKPRKISERKRADVAAFEQWIEKNQSKLANDPDRRVTEFYQSANAMLKSFESKKIITSPREYQLELFERAKERNTIAVLDTGSGKTLIAALLLQWIIQNELDDRARGEPKRIAFFVVDKVALVFQQHAVLECNLDHPVGKLCGEIVDAVASLKQFWEKAFEENMAIVCTAEVLNKCLHHSFIRIDQINLLVFDEAHHTKKNHPYARIIKDYYIEAKDATKKPRILGMTASPVDAQVDPRRAAAELEALLHSQIATVADPTMLQQTMCKPKKEIVVQYDPRRRDWVTDLHHSISLIVGDHFLFKKPLDYAKTTAAELGPWITDRYWQLFFGEDETVKLERKTESRLLKESAIDQFRDQKVEEVRGACELVSQHRFSRPALDSDFLSSKVLQLVKILRDQFSKSGVEKRCIVFVTQRTTAMLLADLLQQSEIRIPEIQVGFLVGGGYNESSYASRKITLRDQVSTIARFKSGELNCIFATSVGEEGLDIPDCNLIIRFDLYDTLIQYIQSRGRARQEESTYVHMVERGNKIHQRKVHENHVNENALRKFCESMPEDRKLNGNNLNMDYFLRKERGQKQYTVQETGAKLNFKQSLVCLATFVASLPHQPGVALNPEYVVMTVPGGFQCEAILPSVSPIKSAIGGVYSSKAVAKCSAAFEMCLALVRGKYLDKHLQPVFTKQLPAMRNARLAISSKKKGEYRMRMKPNLWSTLGFPDELYATVLTLADPDSLGRPSCPLLLLTRQPVPQIPAFPLFFRSDRSSDVRCIPLPKAMKLGGDEDNISQALTAFTLRVFDDVFSKEYEATADQLPYFLAPINKGHDFIYSTAEVRDIIDWDTVKFVQTNERIERGVDEPDEFFMDKFVADPWDGSRKFFLRQRRHDLKPTDPVPDGIVPPRHRAWRTTCTNRNILNYSVSLWSKSRARMTFNDNQPVVEAHVLPIRRNLLDDNVVDDEIEPKKCFLILEPMKISVLPVKVVAMAYNLPAIIHRIESTLIALDACKLLDLSVHPGLALEAITKDSDNSDEHDAEKINFQAGMGDNYERLEFLGDSFLKMATTISVYTLIPDKGEFEYHVERMLLISNKNLFNNALEVKLEEYIRSRAFNGRTWYPDGLTLKRGKRTDPATRHTLGDKSIADVCEALIGAAYLTAQGENSLDLAVKAVSVMVKDKRHNMKTYSDYYAAYQKPEWQTAQANALQVRMADKFRPRMGYAFKYPRILRSAFQHPTYPSIWEKLPSYQRLEFLGDALYDMVCVDYLYHRFPGKDPQWLTEHKMAMVSNQFLGCLAVSLDFHKSMMYASTAIQKDILEYVVKIEDALQQAKEEAVAAGKTEDEYSRDFWVSSQKPPKSLPDVVEAYIGAVFVDSEYDYSTVQTFFDEHVRPYFEDMALYDTFANNHPVTYLTNLMQLKFGCTEWRLLVKEMRDGEDGDLGLGRTPQVVCGLKLHGEMITHAVSESSRYAKIAAAKKALEALKDMSLEEFKKKYGCECGMAGGMSTAEVNGGEGEALEHGTAI